MRVGACGAGFTVLALLAAPAALAQSSNACDMLKATLAQRIEATGVRGYSLEAVPASEPTPKDGRVIGNCEGGAFKMVYRRFGGTATATEGRTAPEKSAAAAPPPSPPPSPRPAASAPAPAASRPLPSPTPLPTPAPTPTPKPVAPTPAPPSPSPVPVPSPSPSPVLPAAEAAPPAPSPAPSEPAPAAAADEGFPGGAYWPWLALVIVVPLALWGGARIRYRLRYDEAGLPRGPRLS